MTAEDEKELARIIQRAESRGEELREVEGCKPTIAELEELEHSEEKLDVLRKELEDVLSYKILDGTIKEGDFIEVRLQNDHLSFHRIKSSDRVSSNS